LRKQEDEQEEANYELDADFERQSDTENGGELNALTETIN
jgi:hypothetical protein